MKLVSTSWLRRYINLRVLSLLAFVSLSILLFVYLFSSASLLPTSSGGVRHGNKVGEDATLTANLLLLLSNSNKRSSSLSLDILDNRGAGGGRYLAASPEQRLKLVVGELERIKLSVKNELVQLERKRLLLLNDINVFTGQSQSLRNEVARLTHDADRLRMSITSLRRHKEDEDRRKSPLLWLPLVMKEHHSRRWGRHRHKRLVNGTTADTASGLGGRQCTNLDTCLRWDHCPISSPLLVYLHIKKEDNRLDWPTAFTNSVNQRHLTSTAANACLVLAFSRVSLHDCSSDKNTSNNCLYIRDGQLSSSTARSPEGMIADSTFRPGEYRQGFDVILPAIIEDGKSSELPMLLPARRPLLLTFSGYRRSSRTSWPAFTRLLVRIFERFDNTTSQLKFSCNQPLKDSKSVANHNDWHSCPEDAPSSSIRRSIFCLILGQTEAPNAENVVASSRALQKRLLDCLWAGSIPVVVGGLELPFGEVLAAQWSGAVLRIPSARVTELEVMLRSFPDEDIIEMRRQGRLILDRCLLSRLHNSRCLLLQLSRRFHLLPPPSPTFPPSPASPGHVLVNMSDQSRVYPVSGNPAGLELDDYLGPLDLRIDSDQHRGNISASLYLSPSWVLGGISGDLDPFLRYPSTPWQPQLPSQAQFQGSSFGFRSIDYSVNKAGPEFSESLGGNMPYEQYTVVLLVYDRINVLISTLEGLYNLPYLNAIVVVWNYPDPPAKDLRWPKLHVPIHVVRGKERNSLNNRFLPFDVIKTDAILSLDDDVQMRHDEIIFGFRVWRENRDRIVGFPARYHSWQKHDNRWDYGMGYTCQLSIILTGAAFFHKYYAFLYTNTMPESVRHLINKEKNCEDIAMNFLVSHVTRKPPIKVTSRWTFACPGCTTSLHNRRSHYEKRDLCINRLTRIYGYNPLLYTQFRADSVLFKTRLPADKQKCFKYI